MVTNVFSEIRENNDARWHHGSIFFNPSFVRKENIGRTNTKRAKHVW